MKKIFLIIFLVSLFLPSSILAGEYKADGTNICYEGLVPCGKGVYIGGTWVDGKCQGGQLKEIPCQFCHFFVLFKGILDFLFFTIVPPLAILMIAIAGAYFLFSSGNPSLLTQGKAILTATVIALIIIYGAWLIVNLFFWGIGLADWTGLREGWFQIDCPIRLP